MRPVQERPYFPQVSAGAIGALLDWSGLLIKQLVSLSQEIGFRLNGVLPKDGTEAMTAPLELKTYTTATRPTASAETGSLIYVSDGAAGSKFQGSDGTSWVSLG